MCSSTPVNSCLAHKLKPHWRVKGEGKRKVRKEKTNKRNTDQSRINRAGREVRERKRGIETTVREEC